jgi:hypothetical protein
VSDSENLKYVLEQQEKRLIVLKFIWKEIRKAKDIYVTPDEISQAIGEDDYEMIEVIDYLKSEGLIRSLDYIGQEPIYQISHLDKLEMEAATTRPNERTTHFPSSVIINVQNMNQTTINAGRDAIGNISSSENKATVTNTIQTTDTDFLLQAIALLLKMV